MNELQLRAERRAAPSRSAPAMCMRLDAACIAVPSGDRSMYSSSEGHHV
jgi:hypothetical protein